MSSRENLFGIIWRADTLRDNRELSESCTKIKGCFMEVKANLFDKSSCLAVVMVKKGKHRRKSNSR